VTKDVSFIIIYNTNFFFFCLSSLLCACMLFSFVHFTLLSSFSFCSKTIYYSKQTYTCLLFFSCHKHTHTHTLAYYIMTENFSSFFSSFLFRRCQLFFCLFFSIGIGNFLFCIIYIFRFSVEDLFMKRIYIHTYLYTKNTSCFLFSFFFCCYIFIGNELKHIYLYIYI